MPVTQADFFFVLWKANLTVVTKQPTRDLSYIIYEIYIKGEMLIIWLEEL